MKTYRNQTIEQDFEEFERDLTSAIYYAIGGLGVDMKVAAQDVLAEMVYSYEPVRNHRRKDGYGNPEESLFNSFITDYDVTTIGDKTLNATIGLEYTAPWQHEEEGDLYGMSLADAVEYGRGMHGAGAREFLDRTDYTIEERARLGQLTEALNMSGRIDAVD